MGSHDVRFEGGGVPETVLADEPDDRIAALREALAIDDAALKHDTIRGLVTEAPRSLHAWAAMGEAGRDVIESYAAFRVGYHRGLDALRQSGWRGSGYVRWSQPPNRGFLACLSGLGRCAAEIGEDDEAERIAVFLRQLDPDWPPDELR